MRNRSAREKLIRAFYRKLMFPIVNLYRGFWISEGEYRRFCNTLSQDPEKIRAIQEEKLRELIHFAYENIPYYRKVFQERGLTPSDIQTVEALKKLPILTKVDIRKNFPQGIVIPGYKKWFPFRFWDKDKYGVVREGRTSGTTAESIRFFNDVEGDKTGWMAFYRMFKDIGIEFGDKKVVLGVVRHAKTDILDKIFGIAERTKYFSMFDATEADYLAVAKKIRDFQPDFISGPPPILYNLCLVCRKYGIKLRPKAVRTMAEKLYEKQRKVIEEQLKTKVIDQYGVSEGAEIAVQCRRHGEYHIYEDMVVVELLRDGKEVSEGEIGEVVITILNKFAMPLIRYRVGDLVVKGRLHLKNSCQFNTRTIKSIEGRSRASLVTRKGKIVTGQAVMIKVFEEADWLRGYQLIQKDFDHVDVNIKADRPSQIQLGALLTSLRETIDPDINYRVNVVRQIKDTAKSGKKIGPIISKLDIEKIIGGGQ